MNEHEDISMWDRYTSSSKSVAIYTSYKNLRSILPRYVDMGVVRYIDYATTRLPTLNMYHRIMHKRVEFSVESEVRGVAFENLPDELGGLDLRGNRFAKSDDPSFHVFAPEVNLKQLIEGIVTHPKSASSFREQMQKLVECLGLPTPIESVLAAKPLF